MKIYLVGGAVRDQLIGRGIVDRDYVVTGSSPAEMLALGFEQVGADFPVFLHPETKEEYALARTERKTGFGYGGFETDFNSNVTLEEDLSRRDFTFNAMAQDLESGIIIDPFGGRTDLENGVIRHTSPAFSEDPLRVIRMARFYNRYVNFDIHPSTLELARKMVESGELNAISAERYWLELEKVFSTGEPVERFFSILWDVGVFKHVKFFNTIFGELSIFSFINLKSFLGVTHLYKLQNLDTFLAVQAVDGSLRNFNGIPSSVARLNGNIRKFIADGDNPISVERQITKMHGWKGSVEFNDFLRAVEVAECAYMDIPYSHASLIDAVEEGSKVRASQYPEFTGKRLGEQISFARMCKIAAILKSPNYE